MASAFEDTIEEGPWAVEEDAPEEEEEGEVTEKIKYKEVVIARQLLGAVEEAIFGIFGDFVGREGPPKSLKHIFTDGDRLLGLGVLFIGIGVVGFFLTLDYTTATMGLPVRKKAPKEIQTQPQFSA